VFDTWMARLSPHAKIALPIASVYRAATICHTGGGRRVCYACSVRPLAGVVLLASLSLFACSDGSVDDLARDIDRGKALYAANGCGTCHGLSGRGDGPIAKTLTPPPRDFRDAAAFKNGTDPASVAATIATGLTRDGGQMQSYFHLSDRERHLLARFVISLRESPSGAAHASTQ
jgi:mono/diheme cytochrome c family protein